MVYAVLSATVSLSRNSYPCSSACMRMSSLTFITILKNRCGIPSLAQAQSSSQKNMSPSATNLSWTIATKGHHSSERATMWSLLLTRRQDSVRGRPWARPLPNRAQATLIWIWSVRPDSTACMLHADPATQRSPSICLSSEEWIPTFLAKITGHR